MRYSRFISDRIHLSPALCRGKAGFARFPAFLGIVAVLMALSSIATPAFAQGGLGAEFDMNFEESFGQGARMGGGSLVGVLVSIRSALVRFIKIVIGLSGMVSLTLAVYNMMSGEQGTGKRFALWGAGLVLGVVFLHIVANTDSGAYLEVGFAGLGGLLGSVLEIALSIIAMVTLGAVVVHVMNGERDGVNKLFKWLLCCVVGMSLIEVVVGFMN